MSCEKVGNAFSGRVDNESMLAARITVEAGKRSGQPCIRGLRIAVLDLFGWLAAGKTEAQIMKDYPELEHEDFLAAYEFANQLPDVGLKIQEGLAEDRKVSIEQIIYQVLRSGLERKDGKAEAPYRVVPHALGLRAGLDTDKLNQILDDCEVLDRLHLGGAKTLGEMRGGS